jgi:hypothetical protein
MTASPEAKLTAPTFILSVTSLLITGIISGVNIYDTNVQKQKELEIQTLKYKSDTQISRGELVFKNITLLNSQNPKEQKLAVAALVWTLGKDDAGKLLESVQTFGPNDVQSLARDARNEISNAEIQRKTNISLWQGKWRFRFAGSKSTTLTGGLHFEFDQDGRGRGDFSIDSSPVQGKIQTAELSDDGTIMKGTWSNSAKQSGQFYFQLSAGGSPPEFSGMYSMDAARPASGSANTWSGTKEE